MRILRQRLLVVIGVLVSACVGPENTGEPIAIYPLKRVERKEDFVEFEINFDTMVLSKFTPTCSEDGTGTGLTSVTVNDISAIVTCSKITTAALRVKAQVPLDKKTIRVTVTSSVANKDGVYRSGTVTARVYANPRLPTLPTVAPGTAPAPLSDHCNSPGAAQKLFADPEKGPLASFDIRANGMVPLHKLVQYNKDVAEINDCYGDGTTTSWVALSRGKHVQYTPSTGELANADNRPSTPIQLKWFEKATVWAADPTSDWFVLQCTAGGACAGGQNGLYVRKSTMDVLPAATLVEPGQAATAFAIYTPPRTEWLSAVDMGMSPQPPPLIAAASLNGIWIYELDTSNVGTVTAKKVVNAPLPPVSDKFAGPSAITWGDIDYDGLVDIIFTYANDTKLYWYSGDEPDAMTGKAKFSTPLYSVSLGSSITSVTSLAVGPFGGDYHPDVAAIDGGAIKLFR